MAINVESGVDAQLIVKGEVTFSNKNYGMYSYLEANTKLEINVENGSTFETCGNTQFDIVGYVVGAATFSGTGYTCDEANFFFTGGGTVDGPVCQPCS